MKKGAIVLMVAALLIVPVVSATPGPSVQTSKTLTVQSLVGREKVTQTMDLSVLHNLIDMGKTHKNDFMTIYDKKASDLDVTVAFANLQPFFQALVDSGLTHKSVSYLNDLYHSIRSKIREPKRAVAWQEAVPRTCALWNGIPTPIYTNAICGDFEYGILLGGFCLGTHTVLPTLGVDLFLTYAFAGQQLTLGITGFTECTSGFIITFGFIGVLICTPGIMVGPYFMSGMDGLTIGAGV